MSTTFTPEEEWAISRSKMSRKSVLTSLSCTSSTITWLTPGREGEGGGGREDGGGEEGVREGGREGGREGRGGSGRGGEEGREGGRVRDDREERGRWKSIKSL